MLPGVGPSIEKRLNARGILGIGDLLLHLPKRYADDRTVTPIAGLQEGVEARISGHVMRRNARGYGRKRQVSLLLADDSGQIGLSFFHSGYMMNDARLAEGQQISVRGTPERWQGRWQMAHPDWCPLARYHPGLQPVYGTLAGLSGKRMQGLIDRALNMLPAGGGSPFDALCADFPPLRQALIYLHRPHEVDEAVLHRALMRLKLEELLVYLHLMQEKRRAAVRPAAAMTRDALVRELEAAFPFPLTEAQTGVWHDIRTDLASGMRMHRLLQGDVGAGKTWIAALAMTQAFDNGLQAALLAPTEVLAGQHHQTLRELLTPLEMEVGLLTGGMRAPARRKVLQRLVGGQLPLVVGTHALLSEDVRYERLGLALVDEQHRFGVRQRWALAEKGEGVHLLGMTATPIPRSLALALYGDMDLSLMRGMPPGRKPVETRVISTEKMGELANGIRRILDAGGRVYWIVPRINEDEDGISVDQRAEALARRFPDANVQGLHGRMKSGEKRTVLDAFAEGSCRILVSTTVVEVGVNVPEARLIVIDKAEQYGLAQLHQLRGRVGRSDTQGYCILLPDRNASAISLERLQQMTQSHDGLELAEADMKMRGAGDVIGVQQSGVAGFRLLDIVHDASLIRQWHPPEKPPSDAMIRFWRPQLAEG
ncbi:MAG TPA: ATP-dependent DNA helicase RecG [Mariprofundaceae bacterium]|nr:ATP-dependent DNA helicase RecG [Mariprofundaceae bacterium]